MPINPYEAPRANLDEPIGNNAPPLWNPNAAANWCLLLSMAFGSYLHMKNWQALNEPKKAANARIWMITSLISTLLVILAPQNLTLPGHFALFALLLSWYFVSAKPQMRQVKERYGDNYPRKGWLKPIGIALILLFGVSMVVGLITALTLMA